jgi:HEAT repeat protein
VSGPTHDLNLFQRPFREYHVPYGTVSDGTSRNRARASDMDYSITFARHFARLVWLLLNETANVDEQKAALRALVAISKDGPVTLGVRDWRLVANGNTLTDLMSGAPDLAVQMVGHGVRALEIDAASRPADLLGVARILASETTLSENGEAAQASLVALGTRGVRLTAHGDPRAPAAPKPAGAADRQPDPSAPQPIESPGPTPASDAQPPALDGTAREGESGTASLSDSAIVNEEGGGMWTHFSAAQMPTASLQELLGELERATSATLATRALDDLVAIAENAVREGKPLVVADAITGIVGREAAVQDAEIKRAYVMAIRRLSRPALLRAVALLLPRKRESSADYVAILTRTGEDGADALIEQLTQAQTADDRRILFDVLLELQAGVPALIHMLGDARWFVARNAADLLGEMKATVAEPQLTHLLRHADERVRRAATNALMRLDTPTGLKAIHDAIRDESPQVRMQAAAAIGGRKDDRNAGTLTKALDEEGNAEVQLAIIAALGKVATPDAVQKLIRAAQPEGRFFKKKPASFRVAAVQALAEARTPPAVAALATLEGDKEREVREAAARALAHVSRLSAR